MAQLKLTYFDFHGGRGEPARLALFIGGIAFEDDRVKPADWARRKSETPFGALPVLEVDGQTVAQSNAINRYVGKLADLYPSDPCRPRFAMKPWKRLRTSPPRSGRPFLFRKSKRRRSAVCSSRARSRLSLPTQQRLEAHGSRYFAADRLSVADLKVFVWLRHLKSGALDHVPTVLPDRLGESCSSTTNGLRATRTLPTMPSMVSPTEAPEYAST